MGTDSPMPLGAELTGLEHRPDLDEQRRVVQRRPRPRFAGVPRSLPPWRASLCEALSASRLRPVSSSRRAYTVERATRHIAQIIVTGYRCPVAGLTSRVTASTSPAPPRTPFFSRSISTSSNCIALP